MNAAEEKLAQRAMAGVSQKTPSAWVRGNLGSEDIGGKKVITVLVPSSCTETDDELAVEGAARIALRATSRCVAAGVRLAMASVGGGSGSGGGHVGSIRQLASDESTGKPQHKCLTGHTAGKYRFERERWNPLRRL